MTTVPQTPTPRDPRIRCPWGGTVPCFDDLCHGSDTTLCGLEYGADFCEHSRDPETCRRCRDARTDPDDFEPDGLSGYGDD